MKTLKKITERVSELISKKSEEVSKVNAEIARLNKEIQDGKEFLHTTDDTEEYTKQKNKIDLDEQLITVSKRKLVNVSTPLSDEEFSSLKKEIIEAHKELVSEYGAKVNEELSSMIALMQEYNEKSAYISGLMRDVEDLHKINTNPRTNLRLEEIANVNLEDNKNWFANFITWYYRRLSQIDGLKRAGAIK